MEPIGIDRAYTVGPIFSANAIRPRQPVGRWQFEQVLPALAAFWDRCREICTHLQKLSSRMVLVATSFGMFCASQLLANAEELVSEPRMVILSGVSRKAVEKIQLELERDLAIRLRPTSMVSSTLAVPLQRTLVPNFIHGWGVDREVCLESGPSISELVDEGSKELDFFQYDAATVQLSRARIALACGPQVATAKTLGKLLFLSGLLHMYESGSDNHLFSDAANLAPDHDFGSVYDQKTQDAYRKAHQNRTQRPFAPVDVRWNNDDDITLRLDGTPCTTGRLMLPIGNHFLQWVGPDETALAGALVNLEESSDGAAVKWPTENMQLVPRSELADRVRREVITGRVSNQLSEALATFLALTETQTIILLHPDSESGNVVATQAVLNTSGNGVETHTLNLAPTPANTNRWLFVGGAGVGAAALSTGLFFGIRSRHDLHLRPQTP